MIRKIVIVNR